MRRKVVLDERLSKGFLKACLDDGHLGVRSGPDEKEMRRLVGSSRMTTRSLPYLLLYDDLLLYHSSDWWAQPLDLEGLATTPVDPLVFSTTPLEYLTTGEGHEYAHAFGSVVRAHLRAVRQIDSLRKVGADSDRGYHQFLDILADVPLVRGSGLPDLANSGAYRTVFADQRGMTRDQLSQLLRADPRARNSFIANAQFFGGIAVPGLLHDSVSLVHGVLDAAAKSGAAAAFSFNLPQRSQLVAAGARASDDALALFHVFFRDAAWTPPPLSLGDAMRLRADKRIAAWRDAVHRWSDSIRSGEHTTDEFRREVQARLSEVEKLRLAGRVSGFSTVVALPMAIGEALSGTVGPGIAVSGIGLFSDVSTRLVRRKNRWVLVGARS